MIKRPCYIVSAEKSSLSPALNRTRTLVLIDSLKSKGIQYVLVRGCYKGVKENSIIVVDEKVAKETAETFEQESYLFLNADRKAFLVYTDTNQVEAIGQLVQVPKEKALQKDAYTYNPTTNQFYVVE